MIKYFIIFLLNIMFVLPALAIEEEAGLYKIIGEEKEIKFEDSFFNSLKGEIRYKGTLEFDNEGDNKNMTYPFIIEGVGETKFAEDKYRFFTSYSFARNVDEFDNKFFAKFTNLFIERNINENHRVRLGASRAPIGVEGSMSAFLLPFVNRAQISRTMGNAVSTGISFIGGNDVFEYDIGGYTSTRYTQGLKDGADFIGRIGYKPFYNKDEKVKDLKFYIGSDVGHKSTGYNMHFAAVDYNYKKFLFNTEYAYANGYNGRKFSTNEAQGFFATAGYNLTPKVQLIARYDYFDKDMKKSKNTREEYSAGINFFVLKERLRFTLNYVFSNDRTTNRDGHGVYFSTQFFI